MGFKKEANVKHSVFKCEQPTRVLQNVAGISNKTFEDEPLKAMLYQGQTAGEAPILQDLNGIGLLLVPQGQRKEMLLSEGGQR